MRAAVAISMTLLILVASAIVVASLMPRHHPGFADLSNPWAEPWCSDPRTEYGWPSGFVRVFDTPSELNAGGRFDVGELVVDLVAWFVIGSLCLIPVIGIGLRRLLSKLSAADNGQVAR